MRILQVQRQSRRRHYSLDEYARHMLQSMLALDILVVQAANALENIYNLQLGGMARWRRRFGSSERRKHARATPSCTHSLPMMAVRVQSAFSGNDLVTLRIEQTTTTVRDVQRLLKHHLAIPKKEQLLFYEGARLAPFEALRVPVNVTFLRIAPVCAHCGRSAPLRSCSGCLAVHYCGTVCQRQHWKQQHRVACSGPKEATRDTL